MGVIVGSNVTMLLGRYDDCSAGSRLLKKTEAVINPHIPVRFELLVGNLTIAILGRPWPLSDVWVWLRRSLPFPLYLLQEWQLWKIICCR